MDLVWNSLTMHLKFHFPKSSLCGWILTFSQMFESKPWASQQNILCSEMIAILPYTCIVYPLLPNGWNHPFFWWKEQLQPPPPPKAKESLPLDNFECVFVKEKWRCLRKRILRCVFFFFICLFALREGSEMEYKLLMLRLLRWYTEGFVDLLRIWIDDDKECFLDCYWT